MGAEIVNLVIFLLIGLAAGWLASHLIGGEQRAWVGNLIVGVIGSVLGGFLVNLFNLPGRGLPTQLVAATGGAVLLLLGLRMFSKRPF